MRIDFHHVGISVPDLDAALAWYERVLGFTLEKRFLLPRIQSDTAFIRRGPLRVELFAIPHAAPLPPERSDPLTDPLTHGTKHVGFSVDDLDAFLAEMEGHGVDIAIVARNSPAGFDACYIRDCAGNLLEFVEQPPCA